jgi:hypothetical protein
LHRLPSPRAPQASWDDRCRSRDIDAERRESIAGAVCAAGAPGGAARFMEPGGLVATVGVLGLKDVEHDNIEQSHIEDSMQSITTDTAPLTNLEEPLRGQTVPEQITRSTLTEPKETLETEQVKPRFYQAIGFVDGILEIDDQKSILRIGEDSYPAVIQKRLKAKCKTTETQLQ